MSDERDVPALDRLNALEVPQQPPRGSAAGQLAASIVLPGVPTIRRIPALGLLLFTVGVAAPIVVVAWVLAERGSLIELALDSKFLTAVVAAGLAVVIARLAAIAEVAYAFRRSEGIGVRTGVATLMAVLL